MRRKGALNLQHEVFGMARFREAKQLFSRATSEFISDSPGNRLKLSFTQLNKQTEILQA